MLLMLARNIAQDPPGFGAQPQKASNNILAFDSQAGDPKPLRRWSVAHASPRTKLSLS